MQAKHLQTNNIYPNVRTFNSMALRGHIFLVRSSTLEYPPLPNDSSSESLPTSAMAVNQSPANQAPACTLFIELLARLQSHSTFYLTHLLPSQTCTENSADLESSRADVDLSWAELEPYVLTCQLLYSHRAGRIYRRAGS